MVYNAKRASIFLVEDGSASAPAFSFIDDPDTGFVGNAGNSIFVTLGATNRWQFGGTLFQSLTVGGPHLRRNAGTVALPSYAFNGDPNTGIFSDVADTLKFATGGVLRASIDANGIFIFNHGIRGNVIEINQATYTLDTDDYIIQSTYADTGVCTITLPDAQNSLGRIVIVKDVNGNADNFNITIDTDGGAVENASYVINKSYGFVALYGDGDSNWWVIAESGRPSYADIYTESNATGLTLTDQSTWYQITNFDMDGEANLSVPDHTNNHITVGKSGKYLVGFSVSGDSDTVNSIFEFGLEKNNGATSFLNVHVHRKYQVANDIGSISASGIVSLNANDTIEVWIQCTSHAGTVFTAENVNLDMHLID